MKQSDKDKLKELEEKPTVTFGYQADAWLSSKALEKLAMNPQPNNSYALSMIKDSVAQSKET